MRKIIHIDMDAFFASVEQRDNPALRGRPVAVGGSSRRGVVAAASYEARRFGVRSAMPSVTAARLCPDLIFVKSRFDAYRAVSMQIRAIFADYTDLIEPLSLDEAYLDVTANLAGLPSATATAEAIRARIRAETGLTASAGVSYNKLLAKLGSDHNKPDGLCVITPQAGPDFVAGIAVGRFHGIGPVTARRLNARGIVTGADMRAISLADLQRMFGKAGSWYHSIARAEDDRPVRANRIRKSSGSERTFGENIVTAEGFLAAVAEQAARVGDWMDRSRQAGRTVTVKVRYADFSQVTRAMTLSAPVTNGHALGEAARIIAETLLPLAREVRLVGVTLSNLADAAPEGRTQLALGLD